MAEPPCSSILGRVSSEGSEERLPATLSGIEQVVVLEQEAHQRVPAVEELASLVIERDAFHGEWNYRIKPQGEI